MRGASRTVGFTLAKKYRGRSQRASPSERGKESYMRKANNGELHLTQREIQILDLIAKGLSAKEVAQYIGIAPRTVEGHIDTIRLKFQAKNRVHMVAKAVATGLVVLERETVPAVEMEAVPVHLPIVNGHRVLAELKFN